MSVRRPGTLARRVGAHLKALGWRVGIVEIESGGAIVDRLTDIPGSSAYVTGAINLADRPALARWATDLPADPARAADHAAAWIWAELGVEVGLAAVPGSDSGWTYLAAASPVAVTSGRIRTRPDPVAGQAALTTRGLTLIEAALAPGEVADRGTR